ncbi:MAG: transcription termination/antitermination protein NusG [Pedosphaera sp.]|jgi:transcriptional antiterminator NusG|nr:transcription termination/antitermination protein NusG [Pedosphaera sp.]|tara:strand:+ start:711 stop:1259 length:549 start_codon:yes stop_codon:yes gene_type:complete
MPNEWYTIQTLSGQEMKAEKSLRKRIIEEEMGEFIDEILLPMEKVVEVRGGTKKVSQRKLYPGYIFIQMKLYDEEKRLLPTPWDFVRNTQGIIGFLGGERPIATPTEEIAAIKAQITEAEESEKPKVNFEIGEVVKINDGPFQNYNGAVEEIDAEAGKLKVTIDIFGRSTPVELEYWQVEKQ